MKDIASKRWKEVEAILDAALDLDPDERIAFVNRSSPDEEIRTSVLSMLDAGDHAGDFLEESQPEKLQEILQDLVARADEDDAPDDNLDRMVGPYRIVRQLGRGGMGSVYLGVRDDETYSRWVAIKIIRRGMDTDEILDRFRSERRILAKLTHPNIARLLDGGATDDGRPYFVMDFVDGITLTRYCDENRLSVKKRLELFQKVCSAVHYAHQNLIVHRDLKPGNILVTPKGELKLLDFGIAKFTNPDEAGYTVPVTATEMRVMTPEYASPEQVLGEPVTTASDVYQLGILLYELLTGSRPHHFAGERRAEIEKIICEEEPDRPSTAVTLVGKQSATRVGELTSRRSTPLDRLRKELSGDLDRIVLMALRKEPDRRYQSADQFLQDIRRYLAGQPVVAQKDTWRYRSRKFVLRHKIGVGASAVLVLLVLALALFALRFAIVTSRQNEQIQIASEKKDQVKELMLGLFGGADPEFARGREVTARELLETGLVRVENELGDQPDVQAEMLNTIGTVFIQLGLFDEAEAPLRKALSMRRQLFGNADSPELAQSIFSMAQWEEEMGSGKAAESLHREALEMRRRLFTPPNAAIASSLNELGVVEAFLIYQPDEAIRLWDEALAMRMQVEGPESRNITETLSNLAWAWNEKRDYDQAESYYRRALAMGIRVMGADHPIIASNLNNLGSLMYDTERYPEADSLIREAISLRTRLYGEHDSRVANSMNFLARTLRREGDLNQARSVMEKALVIHEETLGPNHPRSGLDRHYLGLILADGGDVRAGISEIEKALSIFVDTVGEEHRLYTDAYADLLRLRSEQISGG